MENEEKKNLLLSLKDYLGEYSSICICEIDGFVLDDDGRDFLFDEVLEETDSQCPSCGQHEYSVRDIENLLEQYS